MPFLIISFLGFSGTTLLRKSTLVNFLGFGGFGLRGSLPLRSGLLESSLFGRRGLSSDFLGGNFLGGNFLGSSLLGGSLGLRLGGRTL